MHICNLPLLLALVAVPLGVHAQTGAVATPQAPAPAAVPATGAAAPATDSARIWDGRNPEFESYLREAPIVRFEDVPIGVTKPQRAYLAPGGLVESVAWKVLPPGRPHGYWESYKSEIAGYELDKLLDIHMVPPTVEKRWKGELAAAVLWLKPIRPWKEVEHLPKPDSWTKQVVRMKMFDNLICNIDRNAGNLLVDGAWTLYLIDHSRAFIDDKKLPVAMSRIDRELWDRMRALDEPTLTSALGKWVDRRSIRALLARRDKMQTVIDGLLKNRSESLVYVK